MVSETEVLIFLKDFKEKMNIWDVLFRDDRGKNTKILLELELRPAARKAVLQSLSCKDFSEGPLEDKLYNGASMWVFVAMVKRREIYIKITMGMAGSSVIYISFHIAEQPMKYPYRQPL